MLEKLAPQILGFEGYILDLERALLLRNGKRVGLRPLALSALIHLVKNKDRVVPREELYAVLWPGIIVDEGQNLNVLIKELRETLGDETKAPTFIETYPRRGYRFIGKIQTGNFQEKKRERAKKVIAPILMAATLGGVFLIVAFFSPFLGPDPLTINDISSAARAQFLVAVNQINEGNNEAARENLSSVIASEPEFPEGYFWMGRSYALVSGVRLDQAEQAKPFYLRAQSLGYKDEEFLSELGAVLLITDLDTGKAKDLATQVLKMNPKSIKGNLLLGWAHLAEGDPKGALPYFHQVNVLDPTLTSESAREGWVYFMAGEAEEAARVCRIIIQAGVKTDAVRYCLMEAYIEMGEVDLAVQQGREMMRISGLEDGEIEKILGPEASARLANFYRWRLEYIKTFDFDTSYGQAFIHLRLGDQDLAFEKLQKEIETRHFPYFLTFNSDPRLNVFRDRPDADKVFLTFNGGTERQ